MSNPDPVRPAPDAIDRLIALLAAERDDTSIEVAETLWLATKIEPVATVPAETPTPAPLPQPYAPVDDLPPLPEASDLPEVPAPAPRANLTLPSPQAGVLPPSTLPVWVADPAMLTNPLEIIRALRPLLQRIDTGLGKRLDEAATVDAIARTQLCLPILAPEQRPYFDLVVVVDRSASMHIWQRLIKDVVRILKRYGLFWNVQVYDLLIDPEAHPPNRPVTLISNPQRPGHRPSEIIDQRGQRIVVVLSDCAATYWWDGTLLPSLNDWGATMPTVVWQMLPPWMWRRTALGQGTAAAFSSDRYGVANHQLAIQIQEYEDPDELPPDSPTADRRLPLPVVTSEVGDLTQWSAMVAGDRRQTPPGFVMPSQGGAVPRASTYAELATVRVQPTDDPDADLAAQQQALDDIARTRVERFLELASPAAQRLVMLLAAAPVITLPVVRLIRDSMLYDVASPLPVAEVFLSGLLQRLPGQATSDLEQAAQGEPTSEALSPHESEQQPLDIQDLVQYDFAPRVRQVLLEFLPPVETIDVINSVSAAVDQRWNRVSTEDFRAFLTDPRIEVPEALQNTKSFASVTADILSQLGPDYDKFAQALRQGIPPPPHPDLGFDPSDFPFQDFEYEVAEFINFPPLAPFEFIEAHFEPDDDPNPFPPPLQPDESTVITLEIQPDTGTLQGLEPFNFIVTTIQRPGQQQAEWEILRQEQQAYRLREPLPGTAPLDMVAIPGGTFLMGSPEDEPEGYADELPQHEVTVLPFFMGAYPVTQAQWWVVANLPQVERELDSDPSNFKGDNRPVESVSWYDAIEFCARLSAHTGRQYRLPTEAEWEYACRAGTTTPFHFGETTSSELANYDASSVYADGPKGEYRKETTPVDYFDVANAFGLSDMHGNVYEWCQDHWHSNYEGAPIDGSAWIEGGNSEERVRRGGSWYDAPRNCRSACRDNGVIVIRVSSFGFRVVCSAPRALQRSTG